MSRVNLKRSIYTERRHTTLAGKDRLKHTSALFKREKHRCACANDGCTSAERFSRSEDKICGFFEAQKNRICISREKKTKEDAVTSEELNVEIPMQTI